MLAWGATKVRPAAEAGRLRGARWTARRDQKSLQMAYEIVSAWALAVSRWARKCTAKRRRIDKTAGMRQRT